MAEPILSLTIRYRVGFFDLYWMFFGPRRTNWFIVVASVYFMLVGLIPGQQAGLLLGPLVLVGGLFGFPAALMVSTGTISALGREVTLVIDDAGASGWPAYPTIDRSWGNLDFGRMRRGVVTLEFLLLRARMGWIAIPLRAVDPVQESTFRQVMIKRAGLDPYPLRELT